MASDPHETWSYSTRVEWMDAGWPHIIPIPEDIADTLKAQKIRRILVTIRGQEFRRAISRTELAGPHFMIGRRILEELGLREGKPVDVSLCADPNPDHVDVPEELQIALDQDPEATERWEAFTPGNPSASTSPMPGGKRHAFAEPRS